AIIALLIGILLPAIGQARKVAREVICGSNLKQLTTAANSYATEFQDRIFAFTWTNDQGHSKYSDLEALRRNGTGTEPQVAQVIDIIRRRTGRDNFPIPNNWIPHVLYTHVVLQDYLAARLPEKLVVCPEDRNRLDWQIDPVNRFDQNYWGEGVQPIVDGPEDLRWPYSASYQVSPAAYDYYQSRWSGGNRSPISQAANHNIYTVPGSARLGNLKYGDLSFPSQKVLLQDSHGRHKGKFPLYYHYLDSSQPLGFFDGSVQNVTTRDANQGWNPRLADRCRPTLFDYAPSPWEPPQRDGSYSGREVLPGYYRWTRGGLKGIDLPGGDPDNENCRTEVDTGQIN
ncbi:MAG: hypothetical protein D6751_11845, partial [Deltaproteobacteria bacterium]